MSATGISRLRFSAKQMAIMCRHCGLGDCAIINWKEKTRWCYYCKRDDGVGVVSTCQGFRILMDESRLIGLQARVVLTDTGHRIDAKSLPHLRTIE